jgi:hypothetical protein
VQARVGGHRGGDPVGDVIDVCHGDGAIEPEFAPARLRELERSCLSAGRARELLGLAGRHADRGRAGAYCDWPTSLSVGVEAPPEELIASA